MEAATSANAAISPKKSKSALPKSIKSQRKKLVSPSTVAKPETAAKSLTKLDQAIALMRRTDGATVGDLMATTKWQAHSVRGAISGAIRKKLKLTVTTEKIEGRGTVYRIVPKAE